MSYRDVKQLVSMGFDEKSSRKALREANNSINDAIQILSKRMEGQERQRYISQRQSSAKKPNPQNYRDIQQLVSMGFDEESAAYALDKSNGDINEAIQILNDMIDENYNDPDEYNEVNYDEQYQSPKSHHKRKSHHHKERSVDNEKSCTSLVLLFFAPTIVVLLILFVYDLFSDKH